MNIKGFDQRQWWIAMLIFGTAFLGAAIAAREKDLIVVALGVVASAFGEWMSHPLQTAIGYGFTTTSYPRRFSFAGLLFDVAGLGAIGFGLYRFLAA